MTKDQADQFLEGLRQSLHAAIDAGVPVDLENKSDLEPMHGDFGAVLDYQYFGRTITVRVGRPAQKAKEKKSVTAWTAKVEGKIHSEPTPIVIKPTPPAQS